MNELLLKTKNQRPKTKEYIHTPVLLNEILRYLEIKRDGIYPVRSPNVTPRFTSNRVYVDCTIGEGGHAEAILEHIGESGLLIGLDKDERILKIAEERLAKIGKNFILIKSDFLQLPSQLKKLKVTRVEGMLFDFGISSLQLKDTHRGFSFRNNGPLDMRFDASSSLTCEKLINEAPYSELYRILKNFGEERKASLIARKIVQKRKEKRIKTTFELAEIASKTLGKSRGRIDPATRTFQAFRIAVNRELESIEKVLPQIPHLLKKRGRVCVISYHSLEDRLVKRSFKEAEQKGILRIITKKPISPSAIEMFENPRSRSAKLRVGERA